MGESWSGGRFTRGGARAGRTARRRVGEQQVSKIGGWVEGGRRGGGFEGGQLFVADSEPDSIGFGGALHIATVPQKAAKSYYIYLNKEDLFLVNLLAKYIICRF